MDSLVPLIRRFQLPWLGVVAACTVIICGASATASLALARQANISITELDCDANPERVVLSNSGDASLDLTGWRLESDPPDKEAFSLSKIGTLGPGQSVTIESGTGAGGPFVWSMAFVFRDDDPSDYARVVDSAGEAVQEVTCATGAPTPTFSPKATPAPASPVVVAGAPDGGGPPGSASTFLSGPLAIALGGSMAAAGLLVIFLSVPGGYVWWRRDANRQTGTVSTSEEASSHRWLTTRGVGALIFVALFAVVFMMHRSSAAGPRPGSPGERRSNAEH
jgi:Lamin Tail Domain